MRRLVATLLLLIVVAVAAFMAFTRSPGRETLAYRTAKVTRGDILRYITATGRLDALVTVKVSSQLSGQIAAVLVDFNDLVKPGQPLARLDSKTFEARVREAQAGLANAKAAHDAAKANTEGAAARDAEAKRSLNRKLSLNRTGIVSAKDIDAARSQMLTTTSELKAARAQVKVRETKIDMAVAALQRAKIDLERTVIRAPIGGIVLMRDIEPGQTVAASLRAPTLFIIAKDLRRMEVRTFVDEADIGMVRRGQTSRFRVDALPGRNFNGILKVIRKAPKIVQNVTIYTVVVSADNPDGDLLPGMTARVRIVVSERRGVLKVPNAALRFRPGSHRKNGPAQAEGSADRALAQSAVWIQAPAGSLKRISVETGVRDDVATEIRSSGLGVGQSVVVGFAPRGKERRWLGIRWGF